MSRLVQCIPNFSTMRQETGFAIAQAIQSQGKVQVLDLHWDIDHARTVVTLVGPPYDVREAILAGVGRAVQLIDLREHVGEHPRIGAADVIPLIPLNDVSYQECVRLSYVIADDLAERLEIPVFLYELSARRSHCRNLAEIRRGGFERLRRVRLIGRHKPDLGPDRLHPSAGASVVGARKPLIAFNVNLRSGDLEVAKRIAANIRRLRDSGEGLPGVKAIGIYLAHKQCAQVSTNITLPDEVTMHNVLSFVEREAEAMGSQVSGIELVGMIRLKHFEAAASERPMLRQAISPDAILDNRLSGLAP